MDPILEKIYRIEKDSILEYSKHLMIGGGTRGGPILVKGKGCWVEDINGKKHIDCTSQSWALYLALTKANSRVSGKFLVSQCGGLTTKKR